MPMEIAAPERFPCPFPLCRSAYWASSGCWARFYSADAGAGVRHCEHRRRGRARGPLEPGIAPDQQTHRASPEGDGGHGGDRRRRLGFGWWWWNSEDGIYRKYVFKPLTLNASVADGSRLTLRLDDPGWLNRRTDDLLPDHGHLMHLYVIRVPDMDLVWHLHPERNGNGDFLQQLPSMPAGRYALFGDIVHANGLPETAIAQLSLPAIEGRPLTGDDAAGAGPSIARRIHRTVSELDDGYRMIWDRGTPRCTPANRICSNFELKTRRANRRRIWSCIWECWAMPHSYAQTSARSRTFTLPARSPWRRWR